MTVIEYLGIYIRDSGLVISGPQHHSLTVHLGEVKTESWDFELL